jgi:nicotinate-nucleotide adenylyltransferase
MTKVGLFFGTFNPVHTGHLIIAEYFVEQTDLKEVWFVISPQNPLKDRRTLLADHHRLTLLKIAIEDNPKFKVTDIEYKMSKPSFTIKTLAFLSEKYPDRKFVLLMGSDNLVTLHKWMNYEQIINYYEIYVYPRPESPEEKLPEYKNVKLIKAPLIEISSTFIRKSIKEKNDVRYFLPDKVYNYIHEMHFYEK